MLSRVAERMYWFGRYMERAENTARLVAVNSNLILDLPVKVKHTWSSLIYITGCDELFQEKHDAADERNVIRFLLASDNNPGSVLSSLKMVRENVRTTREIMPSELWEQINEFYMFVKQNVNNAIRRSDRHEFLDSVIHYCHQINGLLSGGMSHGDSYNFCMLGRNIERADMTSRILDVGCTNIIQTDQNEPDTFNNILWMNVLRSLSAYQMYRQCVHDRVNGEDVFDYLVRDDEFPRAISFCLAEISACFAELPRNDLPLRGISRVQRLINDMNVKRLFEADLNDFIDQIQIELAEIHNQISDTWFEYSPALEQQQNLPLA